MKYYALEHKILREHYIQGYAPGIIEDWKRIALSPNKKDLEEMIHPMAKEYYRIIEKE